MKGVKVKKKLFGGFIEFAVYDIASGRAKELVEEVYREGVRLEKVFNFYDKKSFISQLNESRELEVSHEFLEVLRFALKISKMTEGLYDVSFGHNFLNRKAGKKLKKLKCSYKDIKVSGKTVRLSSSDVLLDFGSIAKGYITDKMGKALKKGGSKNWAINSRGDILVSGKYPSAVKIQHPRKKRRIVASIAVENLGVATSGDYIQYSESYDKSHILNQNHCISVTVVAPTLMEADSYATAFSVLPLSEIEKILKKNKKVKVLCIDKNLKAKEYNNFKRMIFKYGA